ncbi:MAG TPA: hypothetical protein VGL81_23680 [Polyangiaceae bacterium]|jgi:hypothetical protein
MASDKSDPRVGLILQVGVLAIVMLLATRAFLQAYFDRMDRAEIARKIGPHAALIDLRAEEKQQLSSGPMPIDKAMQMIAAKGRLNASPDIMPSASKDRAPLEGWTKMPGHVPGAFALPPVEPAPAPSSLTAPSASTAPSGAPSAAPPQHPQPQQPHHP